MFWLGRAMSCAPTCLNCREFGDSFQRSIFIFLQPSGGRIPVVLKDVQNWDGLLVQWNFLNRIVDVTDTCLVLVHASKGHLEDSTLFLCVLNLLKVVSWAVVWILDAFIKTIFAKLQARTIELIDSFIGQNLSVSTSCFWLYADLNQVFLRLAKFTHCSSRINWRAVRGRVVLRFCDPLHLVQVLRIFTLWHCTAFKLGIRNGFVDFLDPLNWTFSLGLAFLLF